MSWLPHVPSLGRFSPFSGTPKESPASPAARVTEDDFSYISPEDIDAVQSSQHHHHHHHDHDPDSHHHSHHHSSDHDNLQKTTSRSGHHSRSSLGVPIDTTRARSRSRSRMRHPELEAERANRPSRETDVIHFRHKGHMHPIHFAAYAIDEYTVTVGQARDAAARRVDAAPGRVRMFWRGRNLKDGKETLRDMGMRSADKLEVLIVVGDRDTATDEDGDGADDGESEDVDSSASGGKKKKKRSRRGKKSRKSETPSPAPAYTGGAAGAEHLPIPSGLHPSHKAPTPSSASRQPSPQPTTPVGKLQALEDKFRAELQPMAEALVRDPPREKEKREYEHKKVTETIMTQILLKVDGVETEGDEEARKRRKGLVKEVQGWLTRVDEVVRK